MEKMNKDKLLTMFLAGELSEREAREVEAWLESDEFDNEMREMDEVGDRLRESDPSNGVFAGVDLYPAISAKLFTPSLLERVLVARFAIAGIAAALIVALLITFLIPVTKHEPAIIQPPAIEFAMSIEYKTPAMSEFAVLSDTPGTLPPGTLVRSTSYGYFRYADGSSISFEPDTLARIGGKSQFNYSLFLLQGKIIADIRSESFRIATQPALLASRCGVFELFQDNPYRHANAENSALISPRPWQWVTTLAVHSGIVTTGEDIFTENDCRVWAFDGPTGTEAAMLEKFLP